MADPMPTRSDDARLGSGSKAPDKGGIQDAFVGSLCVFVFWPLYTLLELEEHRSYGQNSLHEAE